MTRKPIRRALALFLACQPVLWMNNVVLAQSLDEARRRGATREGEVGASPFAFGTGSSLAGEDEYRSREPVTATPAAGAPSAPGAPGAPSDQVDLLRTGKLPPVDAPIDPTTYVCGPGDVFELNFWGLASMKLRVTADMEGRAFVPRLGYTPVAGKTLAEVRATLRETMARNYPRLGFDISLAEPRSIVVHLVDAVARPGSKVARAVDRVATVIAREGGLGPQASKRRIEIHRRDGSVLRADLLQFTLTGDIRHNPYLVEGDVVRVPFEEVAATIGGAVNRPGRYELTGTRDLAELVALAGGLAPTATRTLPVSVVRRQPDDSMAQQLVPFPAGAGLPSFAVEPEDAVRVPSAAELEHSVMVVGAVAGAPAPTSASTGVRLDESTATRRIPFAAGDSVRTLLERVGGVGPLADLERAYIIRGGKSVAVNLFALVMLRDLTADVSLELGDTLVVPFKQRNVAVLGAVFTPGSFPYNPNFGVEQYLALAGGRNRFAQSLSSTRIITPEGVSTEYKAGLEVGPGSSLVVPERNFSRSEVVQIGLGIASVIISGVAVMIAAKN